MTEKRDVGSGKKHRERAVTKSWIRKKGTPPGVGSLGKEEI